MVDGADRVTHRAYGAGRWFPGDPDVLRQMVSGAIDGADVTDLGGRMVAGISPHAGFIYSGRVAGHTYAALRQSVASTGVTPTVVVLGFSHREAFPGVAILDGDALVTPLGEASLDVALGRALVAATPAIRFDARPHAGEHSAENQVPFLQVAVPDAPLVVALMGDHEPETMHSLATALHAAHQRQPLVVIASTDLLHDADYDRVCQSDAQTLDLIGSLDVHRLRSAWDYSRQVCCGLAPVMTMMAFSRLCGVRAGKTLSYRNSGDDFPESRGEWVVGYGSLVCCDRQI